MNESEGIGHALSVWAVNTIANNPNLIGWLIIVGVSLGVVFFLASMACSGIRYRYPSYAEMPSRARWWLGILMPLALNWQFIGKKIGMQPDPQRATQ
jgi:hypothetical protein